MTTNITILKSEDPYHFWGREVPGPGMSEETIKFQGLIGEIQDYCSSDQYVMEYISDPVKGKMYLAQRLSDGVWYRVRVLNNLQTSNGIKSNCHMVDYGELMLVPISRLKDIPAKLKAFPVQAKPFRLHGVQPTTLSVDLEENVAELSPCEKWDQAAVEFFNKLIQGKSAQVDIHGIGRRETRFVTLYINTQLGQVNVNEELVSQKFAVRDERDFDEVSEIGSSEGAPSRPVTPRTYTPQITSPRKAEGGNLDSKGLAAGTQRDGAVGNASRVLPWRQTTKSPSSDEARREGASVSPPNRRSPGVTVDRADEIRGHLGRGALQDVRLSSGDEKMSPSIHKVERMGADHSNEETSGLTQGPKTHGEGNEAPQTVPLGRGRGLPAFGEQSEVGRTRSPSPASSSSPPATSNIRKSDNLQRMMAKSPSPAKSPQPSDVSDSSPQEAPQSQKRRVQDRDGVSTSPEPSTKPSTPSLPLRLPFIKAPVVRPKEKTPLQGVLPPEVSRLQSKSPPSFISPVNDEKVARVPWRRQATPPSSDWNKRSSASGGNSETSDQDSSVQPGDTYRETSAERTKIIQRSLMRQLAPDDGTVPQPSSSASFDHRHGYDMGVVIHGEHIPEPIKRLPQAPFPDVLKRTFENVAPSGVSLIQACAWKAVLRGRDVVGIAPRDSGSSLAYILPLVTQLLQPDTYTSLPAGNGPLALIVCPSWLEATTIAEQCDLFVKAASKTLKTILIYGGGNEHQQEVQLVNGCHILVSTIPCVLRMLESNHTNLNRLCHLVFDNAHILFRDFNTEVKELMRVYSSSLLAQSTRSAPRQLLVFASEWRASLGSFLRVYMTNQMVVVTHKLEGAIYAKVRQSIEVVQDSQRTGVLLGKLQSGLAKGTKVIIFTNDRKKANDLTKILVSSSHYTLMATEDMMTDTLDKVKKEWSAHHRPDSIPLLVMTDGAIKDMGVTDAAYIIHFDFPPSKNAYGRRLGCMMRHYEVQLKQVKKSKCQSILFVDKTNTYAVSHLADILTRSGQGVPSHVAGKQEIEQAKEERKKTKPLCHSLKCFGVCRDQIKCSSRHMVFPEVDTPGSQKEYIDLPTQGTVMVLITHVVDASCYYARLIKHRPSDHHHTVSMETDAVQLNLDLQAWYADPAHQLAQRPLKIGQVCGVVDSVGCYARVQVLSWVAKATEDSPATAEVQYVDDGHYQEVSVDKLLRLPDNLLAVKFQAVEVVVCKAKPTDKDFSWTTHADLQMYQLLQGKLLEGNIALSLGNTLWLDPLVERKYLKETKALMTIYNVRQELIRRKFAVNNPEHIQNLRQLCEGKVKLPPVKSSTQEKESLKLPPPAQLSKDTANLVHLSAVDSPHCFYVQLVKSKYRLERLMETLNQRMANHTQTEDTTVAVGDFCLAQFPLDGRWYRGQVKDSSDNAKEKDIFFVDWGDQEWVSAALVCPMLPEFCDLPAQAIQCSMRAVEPVCKDGWSEVAGTALWDMCSGGAEGVSVPLTVEVVSSESCEFTGGYFYSVDVFDQAGGEKIAISKKLIEGGHARPTADLIKVMVNSFDGSSTEGSPGQQLNKLCAQLYQTKSLQGQLTLINKINQELANVSDKTTLMACGCVRALCHVLCNGQLRDDAKEQLVLSLIELASGELSVSCEVVKEGALKGILTQLQKTGDQSLKEDITGLLKVVSGEKRPRDLFLAARGLAVLADQLASGSSSLVMVSNVCGVLRNLLHYNDVVKEQIPADLILAISRMVKSSEDANTLTELLHVLTDIAKTQRNREIIEDRGCLDTACEMMWCATDNQVIKAMAQFLHSMSDSRSARQTMIREELPPSLEGRCISERTNQDTKDACLELLGVLDEHEIREASLASSQRMPPSTELTFPKTHPTGQSPGSPQTAPLDGRGDASGEVEEMEFDDMPPLVDSEEELEIAHPKVLWSQRPSSVLLSVQLRGVVNPEVHVTTNSISFCAILGSMQYEFELALFSRVDSSNFVVAPAGGEVLITLYKESIGIKWTRLTHSKKLPFVGIDFERWKDDDDLESERKKVKQRAPKKAPGRIAEPGSEEETSEEESSEDFSDFSGDEFDKAFEDVSHSSEEKQETGYSS